jgi:hypothetical protein
LILSHKVQRVLQAHSLTKSCIQRALVRPCRSSYDASIRPAKKQPLEPMAIST